LKRSNFSRPGTICRPVPAISRGPTGQAKAQKRKNSSIEGISEGNECWPSSDYAGSKLDAERRLIALANEGVINSLVILRLAPVYDREWNLNLDRRVFAPGKLSYLRFGSGSQKMSALARPNLVDFIAYLIEAKLATETPQYDLPDLRGRHRHIGRRKEKNTGVNIFNICDAEPYDFNTIIRVFKKSGIQPNRSVISVPLLPVWVATRITGVFFPKKREWIHSCYDKLASDLVFDNTKMMNTGFRPKHSLETIFDTQMATREGANRIKSRNVIS